MARVEHIPTMSPEELDRNEDYAMERAQRSPQHTHWRRTVEMIHIRREFDAVFARKLEEYRAAARRELPQPIAPRK